MKTILRILAVAAMLIVGTVAVPDENGLSLQALERSLLFPANADISDGKILAADTCGSCHNVNGISSDPAVPHLAGQHVIYLYNELNAYKDGGREDKSMNKAMHFLSEDAMRKVSAYYASLMPPTPVVRAVPPDDLQPVADDPVQLGKVAAATCAGCHGAIGNSQIPGIPNLTAQSAEYFGIAMTAYKSDGRPGNMMNALVSSIDEESMQNLALYYALQEPLRTSLAGSGDVAAGRTAAQACASCHGADGNATAADTPTLAGQDASYIAVSLRAYAQGQRDHAQMVTATVELGDAEIDALAAFYAQQEPIARKVHRPPTIAEWIERCDRCHGIGGNSTNPRYPSLASQNEIYLARVIENYASGGRQNSTMSAMSQPLRPSDIEALAAHYASLPRKSILYVELPCTPVTSQ
jgi:cytochrome c553